MDIRLGRDVLMQARKFGFLIAFSCFFSLHAATYTVTSNADSGAGSLRNTILGATSGDTINFDPSVAGTTITLLSPLPPINPLISMNIQNTNANAVTINGQSLYQIFSVTSGTITLENLVLQNGVSTGGAGGAGYGGGGGGGAGGGGLYVQNGAAVTMTKMSFLTNQAIGGAGGIGVATSSGGGGGGFAGGAGGVASATIAGGGGGGNPNAGAGGSATTPTGGSSVANSLAGAGGGATGGNGGVSGGNLAGMSGANGGGGGAGAGGNGGSAGAGGGTGGTGIGGGGSFGGGGGGGGAIGKAGGAGVGTGGGGGAGGVAGAGALGGAGGLLGGGGGGGSIANAGGVGGLGGGGGGAGSGAGGTSVFGGGTGGAGAGSGGGGGAGLGGAIFVQNGATLTVSDGLTLTGNSVTAGVAGAGTSPGTNGKNLGPDLFLTSGATLNFTNTTANIAIATAIESDQGAGGGTGGGVIVAGTKTVTLTGVNTYTGTNTISSTGTLNVSADTGLGVTANAIVFTGAGIFQAGGSFSSARNITLTANGTIDTQGNNVTFATPGIIGGAGSLTSIGTGGTPGILTLTGSNSYSGGTIITTGTLNAISDASLGNAAGSVTLAGATLQMGANFTSSNRSLILNAPVNEASTIDTQTTSISWNGPISGTGPLTKIGTATLTLVNGANSYTGGTNINAGTLNVGTDGALGNVAGNIAINTATLQAGSGFTNTSRTISLTGSCTIDTQTTNLTLSNTAVISGAGSLTKIGSGILTLQAVNTYTGGSTISAGTLNILADSGLGGSAGTLSIGSATLQAAATFSSARTITLTGAAIIDTQANTLTLSGPIGGSGATVTKIGTGTLILTGTNTFSNIMTINAGTVEANSTSLPGNIVDNAALIFNQTTAGTYAGVLTGSGTMTKQGTAQLSMTGDSSAFTGAITVTAGDLNVDGKLGGSLLTISPGGTLSGTGTVSNVTNNGGTISPGDGIGTLKLTGNLILNGSSVLYNQIEPGSTDLLAVTGTATLGGTVTVAPTTGFYGVQESFTILTGSSVSGTFSSVTSTDSNFVPSLSYPTGSVVLTVLIVQPFLGFETSNRNTRSVANNIDALGAAGALTADSPLLIALNSLAGKSNSYINSALDQMHPAQYSALDELQAEVGSQLASLFHHHPIPSCYCENPCRIWVEPYGNWLKEEKDGLEIGFTSNTKGVAFGFDSKILDQLVLGCGGAWDNTDLTWHEGRGHASINGLHASIYSDYTIDMFYLGASFVAGMNDYHTYRNIPFLGVDNTAMADFHGLDLVGQLSTAVMFGPGKCCVFPYVNVDILYLGLREFHERNVPGLQLDVRSSSSTTLRTEAGIALKVEDTNYNETMCISPQVAIGWAMECPLHRKRLKSNFVGQSIPFTVEGWDRTWQLFTADFGLTFSYTCYSLSGEYHVELCPDDGTKLFDQRGNFHFDFRW